MILIGSDDTIRLIFLLVQVAGVMADVAFQFRKMDESRHYRLTMAFPGSANECFCDDLMTIQDQLGIKERLITHFDTLTFCYSNYVNRIETMAGAVRT